MTIQSKPSDAVAPFKPLPRLVTINDARASLNVSRRHIYSLIARGQLHAIKLGNAVRFKQSDIEALIEGVQP